MTNERDTCIELVKCLLQTLNTVTANSQKSLNNIMKEKKKIDIKIENYFMCSILTWWTWVLLK